MNNKLTCIFVLIILFLTACGNRHDPEAYSIPPDSTAPQTTIPQMTTPSWDVPSSFASQPQHATTQQIHPDMPKFTFIRTFTPSSESNDLNFPTYDVSIYILDANGVQIQQISGLQQQTTPYNFIDQPIMELSFIDLNFDGYMDMRLFSIFHSERYPFWGIHYHWLWDSRQQQFVLNQYLTDNITSGQVTHHYAYIGGEFTEVRREETNWIRLHPSHDAGQMIGVHIDSHYAPDTWGYGNPQLKHISIFNSDFELIQEIRDIHTNVYERHGFATVEPTAVYSFATFNAHFVDYNGDGYLDFALATDMGGSLGNSPRRYWMWCPTQNQFVENESLSELSIFGAVGSMGDGRISFHFRENSITWVMWVFRYEDGEFVFEEEF